jgi:hypothetical protein
MEWNVERWGQLQKSSAATDAVLEEGDQLEALSGVPLGEDPIGPSCFRVRIIEEFAAVMPEANFMEAKAVGGSRVIG